MEVNGVRQSVQAIAPSIRCGGVTAVPTFHPSPPAVPIGFVSVTAPIDDVRVEIAESFPPKYFLIITSGLPNSCVRFGTYEVERIGDAFQIKVTNLQPADSSTVCAQVYGTVEHRISLGTEFIIGTEISVIVNDFTMSFIIQGAAQVPTRPSSSVFVALDRPFQLGLGESVKLESADIEIHFAEVTEDSRCPASVVCIWAGRATIAASVLSSGGDTARVELTLPGGGAKTPSRQSIGEHSIELKLLEPYPGTPRFGSDQKIAYVATLVVSR